jgi:CheY-like chemotaxis protein
MAAPAVPSPEGVVLVVDDQDPVRQVTVRILRTAGFRVLEARDGAEALDLLAGLGPKVVWLVVSDVVMPRLSGRDLAAVITRRWPTIRILLLSAIPGPPTGFNGSFLQKPFTPETLVAAARALLPGPTVSAC